MDWKSLIQDLRSSGLTQHEIAEKTGCSQAYISDLSNGKRGKSMSYEIGMRLRDLHKATIRNSRAA
jgi:transcriptional regulator with XRE-family HTH domain